MSGVRVQLHRTKGWRKPPNTVNVARPSKWGNPFRYRTPYALARVPALDGSPWEYEGRCSADGYSHEYHHENGRVSFHCTRYMSLDECVELYRRWLHEPTPEMHLGHRQDRKSWITVDTARAELAGKDLACWCPLNLPCHADVLLEAATEIEGAP